MALVSKRTGSTTVAGTLAIAHLAGLRVFVTGGIGGVHRWVRCVRFPTPAAVVVVSLLLPLFSDGAPAPLFSDGAPDLI